MSKFNFLTLKLCYGGRFLPESARVQKIIKDSGRRGTYDSHGPAYGLCSYCCEMWFLNSVHVSVMCDSYAWV